MKAIRKKVRKRIKRVARHLGTQPDKVKHVAVSFTLVVVFFVGLAVLGVDAGRASLTALGLALLVGLGKEVSDRFTGGDCSIADMAANIAGAVPAALALWLIAALWRQM